MSYCKKCGAQVEDGAVFCPECGAHIDEDDGATLDIGAKIQELNDTADTTADYSEADITKNKGMAILSYFGILVLIPIFAAKDSLFAKYHVNQGLVLALTEIAYAILMRIVHALVGGGLIYSLLSLVDILFLVLAIIGIVNASKGRAKELPIIGGITILK